MRPDFPELHILPLPALILHEDHDQQRTIPLIDKLRAQGILRNPPIVMPLQDGSQRYMVLDGANRVTALQSMDFPHIVAQVVQPDDPNVHLGTWHHVVWGMDADELEERIRQVANIRIIELQADEPIPDMTQLGGAPVYIELANGQRFVTNTSDNPLEQVAYLHGLVDTYKTRGFLDRTSETRLSAFEGIHNELAGLFIFPPFDVHMVLHMAGGGNVLPTGLTRFTISPRALHLNYPLHELSSAKPVEYKEAYLRRWIQERVKKKAVRYYAESTYLFDE